MFKRTTTRRARRALHEALEPRRLLAAEPHHWPAGPEVQVSAAQSAPVMAMDGDGDYVIVWTRDGAGSSAGGIYAQRYDASGVPQGSEFGVADTPLSEVQPAVAMDADGDFVVTFASGYTSYYFSVSYKVYARRYNAAGVAQGGEFLVNTFTPGNQYQSSAAMDADGDFVVAWTSSYQDGNASGIYAQRFNAAGVPQGAEFRVNSYTPQWQDSPSAAMDADGDFVVTWRGSGVGGSLGIQGQRFNAAGLPQGSEFLVSISSNGFVRNSSVAMDADGDFVVVWEVNDQYIRPYGIGGQRYNASGVPQGAMFGVEPSGALRPGAPDVAMNASGEFAVTWNSSFGDDTLGPGAYVQRYDAAGLALGTRFRVNTAGNLRASCVGIGNGGGFVVAAAATSGGIRARRYATFGPADAATVGDRVWNDTDADGIQGAGEAGIGGATIEFSTADGAGIALVTTGANGQYGIPALLGASARLRFATPAGYLPTRPDRGGDDALDSDADRVTGLTPVFVAGAAGMNDNRWDAGFCLPASAGGVVFNDRNGNGVRDGGEEGMAGFEVFADLDGDGIRDPDEPLDDSDDAGRYTFSGVLGGVYPIVVIDQDLWVEPAFPPVHIPPGAALDQIDRPVRTAVPDRGSAPQGPEFRVNAHTTGDQGAASVAMAAEGSFVVAWSGSGEGDDAGVFAQRYNPSGVSLGSEFRVNTYTTGIQTAASAAMDGDGDFVIVWQSYGQDGSDGGIFARRYNAAGVVQGSEFRVNTYTEGGQLAPAAAMDAGGDFVVAWQSGHDGGFAGVYAQRYDTAGVAQGDEFRVNSTTSLNEIQPAVAMDADGDFVVSWSHGYNGYYSFFDYDVYAQRYNAAGLAQGGEFRVSTSTLNDVTSTVGTDADGAFVIAWVSGFEELEILAQRYNASGAAQGAAVRVSRAADVDNVAPAVAMNAGGDHVVTWRRGGAIAARRYNAAGVRQGAELRVNSGTSGAKDAPAVAVAADGDFVIAWESEAQDGSGRGIYAQRYVTFGDPKAATIGDRVWNDANGNGIQEASEAGIAGAVVDFFTTDGVLAATTKTDAAGRYTFAALAGASGFVRFVTPDGFIPTRRDRGADDELDSDADRVTGRTPVFVTGTAGTIDGSFDAGFVAPATVSGVVFFDRSGDGVRNGGEEPLGGFEVFADFDADGAIDADEPVAVSGPDGAYAITSALGGTYPITVVAQDLWVEPAPLPTVVAPGGNVTQINFPVRTSASDSVSVPSGSEFRVNSRTANQQSNSMIAMDADGDFVIVWNSYNQDGNLFGVYGQRYNAAGVKQGAEFRVNTFTTGHQNLPTVAMDDAGNFVVAWSGTGSGDDNNGVFAQRYNAAGTRLGNEFRVNTYTTEWQFFPSAAMDASGDFVITWMSNGQDGSGAGVYARRYDAAGAAQGGEFRVSAVTAGNQSYPVAAMDAGGNFLITWSGAGAGDDDGVFAQRYDAAALPQGSAFRVNAHTTDSQHGAAVAMDGDGDFVIAWQNSVYGEIQARRYNAAGVPQGAEVQVNTHTDDRQSSPRATMDGDGDFVIFWNSQYQDGSLYGVYGQRYNAAGVPQQSEFRVNTYTTSHQIFPSAAVLPDGDLMVTWSSVYQDGDSQGIYARRYDVSARPAVTASQFVWLDAPQRVEFTFDQDVSVSLSTADLVLRNQTTGQTIPSGSVVMSWNAATRTATFRFPTLPNGGSLPDGRYRATLAAAGVSNPAGTTIAVDHALDFFVLGGDANRDARVNLADFNILAANFGQTGRDFSRGDFNYDGLVNLSDFNLLASRFGQALGPDGQVTRTGERPPALGGDSASFDDDDEELDGGGGGGGGSTRA